MEEREKRHINDNFSDLVDTTDWNTTCITVPRETGVFGYDDISKLKSIPDERMRVLEFYELFMTKHNSYQHLITTLTRGCQSGAVKILNRLKNEDKTSSSQPEQQTNSCSSNGTDKKVQMRTRRDQSLMNPVRFDVYNPVHYFTGRVLELESLHEKLQQGKTKSVVISQMASIVGLGGIGKTELARMYIQKYAEEYDNNVIWIRAETEETLKESFRRLATDCLKLSLLGADGKDKHINSIIDEDYKFFEGRKCIFVFDNAESHDYLHNFMPFRVSDPPHILITSRDKEWEISVEMLLLNEMEKHEAIEFVKASLQIVDESHDKMVNELVKELQCFPLALSQAISYIKQQQMLDDYGIDQYLKEYKLCSEKLLSSKLANLNSYTKTTFTTWKITIETISKKEYGNEAISLLNMISFFEPDKIPKALLLSYKNNESTTHQQDERNQATGALLLLIKYSMVNAPRTEKTISIHRLVQEVIRIELRRTKMEEKTLRDALKLFSENSNGDNIHHFTSVFKFSADYKKLVVEFSNISILMLVDFSVLNMRYNLSGVRIANELKEVLRKHVSASNPVFLLLEGTIAAMNNAFGNSEDVLKNIGQVIQNGKNKSAEAVEQFLQLNKATALRHSGKLEDSLNLYLQIYKHYKARNGQNHYSTISALANVANCLQELGHFEKPFPVNVEYMQVLSNEFNSFTDPSGIIKLLKSAYENNKHWIRINGYYTATMITVAEFFINIKDNDTASIIAKDIYEQGKNSNDSKIQLYSMMSLNSLGKIKEKEQKYEEAYNFFKEAHKYFARTQGNNDILTIQSKMFMSHTLSQMGQSETKLEEFQDILKTLEENVPNRNLVDAVKLEIDSLLAKKGTYQEILETLVKLRASIEDILGRSNPLWSKANNMVKRVERNVFEQTKK